MVRIFFIIFIILIGTVTYASTYSPSPSSSSSQPPHGSPFGGHVSYVITAKFQDPAYTKIFHTVHTGIDMVPIPLQDHMVIKATIPGALYHFSDPCTGQAVLIVNSAYIVYMGHVATFLVPNGKMITYGEPIATIGATGKCATGIHVHYEIHQKVGNTFILVDPVNFLD